MKRVLITGATGFIGRHCLPDLLEAGYEVHAIFTNKSKDVRCNVEWHQANLLDSKQILPLLRTVQPTHLLHLAWSVNPGKFHTFNEENLLWVLASLELLRQFYNHGGKRVVMAGSCAEYDWAYGYCSEFVTPTMPNTFYGACKNHLGKLLESYSREIGLSYAWARIFFLYGPYEYPVRLVPAVLNALFKGEIARCSHGRQIRDYLHVQDVANALVALLNSAVMGPVNIASGRPVALLDIINFLAQQLGRDDLVELGAVPAREDEPPLLVANVMRLSHEVGWNPRYDLKCGLEQTINWWETQFKMSLSGKN